MEPECFIYMGIPDEMAQAIRGALRLADETDDCYQCQGRGTRREPCSCGHVNCISLQPCDLCEATGTIHKTEKEGLRKLIAQLLRSYYLAEIMNTPDPVKGSPIL
jgi:hypothetical protein